MAQLWLHDGASVTAILQYEDSNWGPYITQIYHADREHSSAVQGEVTLKFSAVRWKSSRGLNLCVYVAALSLGELLMNDVDRWTPQIKVHTHMSVWGPRHTPRIYTYFMLRSWTCRGIHASMYSTSAYRLTKKKLTKTECRRYCWI